MLPLEIISEEALKVFEKHGVAKDTIRMCVQLDLDVNGDFGESWLALTGDKLICISANTTAFVLKGHKKATVKKTANIDNTEEDNIQSRFSNEYTYDEYDFDKISEPYVDNFMSSNRLFLKYDDATIGIVYSTNSKKQKLFAFLDLMNRFKDGKDIQDDDPIFDQFNVTCPKCGRRYTHQNRKVCMHCLDKNAMMKRLFMYFDGYIGKVAIIFLLMAFTSVIALINPFIGGHIFYDIVLSDTMPVNATAIDKFLFENINGNIMAIVGIMFAIMIISLIIGIIQNRTIWSISIRVSQKMKMDIFTAMQRLSLSFFNSTQTGRLITRVNNDSVVVRDFYAGTVPALFINVITFVSVAIFLFSMNWRLTLIIFIPVPIIVWIFRTQLPKLWRLFSKRWRRSSSLNSMLGDSLNGIRVVKAFAKETEETNRFHGYSDRLYKTELQVNLKRLSIFPIVSLLIGLTSQSIWGFGAWMIMGQEMEFGQLITYIGFTGMIFGPLQFFSDLINRFSEIANSAQRMFEILDTQPEINDIANPVKKDKLDGNVEFTNVCFHYAPNRPILKNMSFRIKQGDYIGLVGHTGAGKSTIANLITRLYDVISGSIILDGENIKNIEIALLRKSIAIVSQEIFLFRGTIADNIRYARPDATMQEIIEASKAANAHDFIVHLPEGYETTVGTGSRSLSGGEQQRISIARALLLNPQILILDEATAAMDTETERLIQEALNVLVKGRTTLEIAHRLSTLRECNYLFAIENGEIAEEGTHTELIAKKGIYHKLYMLQSEAMKRVIQGE